ncbi:nuclear transport factor 2 family protein [Gelatiniphilus marinus]|uniref:Nuclear transport factor 2 family protein n=1 Tax=Gelatiniphilus marinus TaxID=1759464 RepID=A0ABW5JPT1_9FLAO
MKKIILMLVLMGSTIAFAQKKNGTVYIEHPAIDVVETYTKAFVSGDTTKIASLLTNDFKAYNGLSTNPNAKGTEKAAFIKGAYRWFNELDYFSIADFPGAYPDAIQYKKDNKDDVVWVQTWDMLKGVHKTTGVKFSSPMHRLFVVNKDNKIQTIINYFNQSIFTEFRQSFSDRTNGTIYNHHDNINTIRKAFYAFENLDVDKCMSYFSDDATFYDINDEFGVVKNKAEAKASWQQFLNDFEIKNMEMVGYPDYLEYELDNGREVLSWWNYHLVRKSDKKEMQLPLHASSSFDADGKITSHILYYSQSLLNAK